MDNIKINKRNFVAVMVQTLWILITILISNIIIQTNSVSHQELKYLSILGTVSFVIIIIISFYITKNILSPYILFISSFFMFQFGQCLLYIFDINIYLKIFNNYSNETISKGMIITILCMEFFVLGSIFANISNKYKNKNEEDINEKQILAMKKCGWITLCLSGPVKIFFLLQKSIVSLKYGYMSLYSYNGSIALVEETSISTFIGSFFIVSLILLIILYKDDRKIRNRIMIFTLIIAIIDGLSGGRNTLISIILTLLSIKYNLIDNINYTKLLKICGVIILITTLIPLISIIRLEEDKSLDSLKYAFEFVKKENPILTTINEMGGSMSPLLEVIDIIPNQVDYKYGESYLGAASTLIPNIMNIMGETHPGADAAHLAQWLMSYKSMTHGPGFSMIAEGYYNFGYIAILPLFIWGYIFGKILLFKDIQYLKNNYIKLFIAYSGLALFFTFPRGESLLFFRNFIYYILGILVISNIFKIKFIYRRSLI